MDNTITNRSDGTLCSVTGRGVIAYRLKAIIVGLELKQRTGLEVSRRFSILKVAKQTTGLKTNNIRVQIDELWRLYNAEVAACTITTKEVRGYDGECPSCADHEGAPDAAPAAGPTCPECEQATMHEDDHVWICPACGYETSEPRDD